MWQDVAALSIVALTAGVVVAQQVRLARRRGGAGCSKCAAPAAGRRRAGSPSPRSRGERRGREGAAVIIELKALILGVLEGLTEFLPVSSTGHLLLGMSLLGVDPEVPSWQIFLYFIQIGAVLAVFAAMGRNIFRLWKKLLFKVVVALLPAVVIGLAFDKAVEAHLERPATIAIALVAGAILMVLVERRFRSPSGTPIEEVTMRQAVVIGIAQCVSIVPGTSRALATILGGMIAGLSPAAAVEFSFYLAIPTILGATVLEPPSPRGGPLPGRLPHPRHRFHGGARGGAPGGTMVPRLCRAGAHDPVRDLPAGARRRDPGALAGEGRVRPVIAAACAAGNTSRRSRVASDREAGHAVAA